MPDGLPRVLANPYPFEIIQAPPGQITIIYELSHQVRMIAMDKPLPSEEDLLVLPFFNGHSVGHFEGDTLVVELAGFKENTFVDATGAPHTDELRTVERIRKVSPTQLEDVITIHDPEYYSRIGRRASSTRSATTCGSRTMSAASRTATFPEWPACAVRRLDAFPGRGAARSDAPLIRDRSDRGAWNGPGSAAHH